MIETNCFSLQWVQNTFCMAFEKHNVLKCDWNKLFNSTVGSKPFFYGTNNLACMYLTTIGLYRHRRKRSLQLPVHNFVHSFIYYDGWFAEFGTKDTTLRRHSPKYAHCGPKIMHPPAGFTKLPFECLRKCASKYHLVFGNYNLLKNNCHVFSNKMMEVLCHEVACPLWCLWLAIDYGVFYYLMYSKIISIVILDFIYRLALFHCLSFVHIFLFVRWFLRIFRHFFFNFSLKLIKETTTLPFDDYKFRPLLDTCGQQKLRKLLNTS